jgi:hypothetical protein
MHFKHICPIGGWQVFKTTSNEVIRHGECGNKILEMKKVFPEIIKLVEILRSIGEMA